jgi:uncharacterized protein (DUF1015 family)
MPRVSPFEGFVFDPAVTGPLERVTAPPYDVISEARKREFLAIPYGIARLDLPERLPGDASSDPYAMAGALLRSWQEEGALRRVAAAYHAYEMLIPGDGPERRVRGF